MQAAQDKFSGVAIGYRKFRPEYPDSLYLHILDAANKKDCAWDAGTGNGQVANVLARYFNTVIATDISAEQIKEAPVIPNVKYMVSRAEQTNIEDDSVDLVTVAQAIHWFDQSRFAEEVQRVARHDALLAVWGYELLRTRPEIDKIILELYDGILDGYWSPHRRQIENRYSHINFPFESLNDMVFQIERQISLDGLLGYLRTWSAVSQYLKEHGVDPVSRIEPALRATFTEKEITSRTPVFLRMWRIRKR